MKPQKTLVLSTLGLFLCMVMATLFFTHNTLPDSIPINAKGQPTIGYPRAKVHVVLFEEPKCSSCKEFNTTIFPKIKKEFIDSNKIIYTVIPVSFLPGSMPAANALLGVYYADPLYPNNDLFFTYLDNIYIYQHAEKENWVTKDNLLTIAQKASPAINLDQLAQCIDLEPYRSKIERNTEYGSELMQGKLSTPTLYVDGIKVETLTLNDVSKLIKEVLEKKGIH